MIEASQPQADRQAGALSGAMTAAAAMAPVVLFGVALGARLRLAWVSIDTIVLKATADDGYYYFTIARNIAHGHNVTFDGQTGHERVSPAVAGADHGSVLRAAPDAAQR